MVHGTFASGDTWVSFARRFMANGYCPSSLVTFDYNSTFGPGDAVERLDVAIDAVLARTGASQVDLFGHSLGGAIGYSYLSEASRADKVRRYVHIGASVQDGPADADTPMLNWPVRMTLSSRAIMGSMVQKTRSLRKKVTTPLPRPRPPSPRPIHF